MSPPTLRPDSLHWVPETQALLQEDTCTGFHLRHQCHCHSKSTCAPESLSCGSLHVLEPKPQLHYWSEYQHTTATSRTSAILAIEDPTVFANIDPSSWSCVDTTPLCPPRNQRCCTPPRRCSCNHLQQLNLSQLKPIQKGWKRWLLCQINRQKHEKTKTHDTTKGTQWFSRNTHQRNGQLWVIWNIIQSDYFKEAHWDSREHR